MELAQPKCFINQIVGDNGVHVINLKKSTDRLGNVTRDLNKFKIKFQRFNAVNGRIQQLHNIKKYWIVDDEFENDFLHNKKELKKMKLGVIGCAMSHIKVWEKINKTTNKTINHKYEWSLILEDDISLPKDINLLLKSVWDHIPKNTDIVYLGWSFPRDKGKIIYKNKLLRIMKYTGVNGGFAYLIKNSMIENLLKMIPINIAIDTLLANYTGNNIGCYCIKFNNNKLVTKSPEYQNGILDGIVLHSPINGYSIIRNNKKTDKNNHT